MDTGPQFASATVVLTNSHGLHSRPVMKFLNVAQRYTGCAIRVTCRDEVSDGKDVMGLSMLGAYCGEAIRIEARGQRASEAVAELRRLVESRFDETGIVINFLHPSCIKVPLLARTREEVIRQLVGLIARQHNITESERLVSALIDKEREEPWGTSHGLRIALPHVKDEACPGLFTAMARVSPPIDWPAIDHQPVDIVFLTIGRDDSYQKAIIDMSRVLASPSVRDQIRSASSAEELSDSLRKESKRLSIETANKIRLRQSNTGSP
ncbi:MAG: HPr family phosphocarrier protein [Phycisphaerae bacterium]|nr:HPr family phosphocarrier protein [Phycisphaerae bacterium]